MTNRLFLEYRDDRRGRGLIDFAKEAARRGAAVDGATPRVYVFSISTNQTKDGGEGPREGCLIHIERGVRNVHH